MGLTALDPFRFGHPLFLGAAIDFFSRKCYNEYSLNEERGISVAFYRYIARYGSNNDKSESYSVRSLVPFDRNEDKKYFVHTCYAGDNDDEKNIYVSNFGYERDWPQKEEGPKSTDRFLIHYVMSGRGFFNGIEVNVGQFFFTHPYESYHIANDPENPMEYYYIGVEGKGVVDFMRGAGFFSIPKVFGFSFADKVSELIGNALYHVPPEVDYELYFYGIFMQLMAYHKKENRSVINSMEKTDKYTYYKRAQLFIRDCLLDGISPADVARHIHVSPSYLRMIFSEFCQYSVRELIVRKKMDCAINYMIIDDYSVSRVALLLGYEDYSQFSKIFKKYTGMSPNAYKKRHALNKETLDHSESDDLN